MKIKCPDEIAQPLEDSAVAKAIPIVNEERRVVPVEEGVQDLRRMTDPARKSRLIQDINHSARGVSEAKTAFAMPL